MLNRIFNYGNLSVKYAKTRQQITKIKKLNEKLIDENKEIRKNLESEFKRTKTFRNAYRKKVNDYEELLKETKILRREGKKCQNLSRLAK